MPAEWRRTWFWKCMHCLWQTWSVDNTQQTGENCGENSGHFKYDETMRQISALVIKFDPRSPNQWTREENSFKILSESLQNCLPASSFFLFHDIKSNCVEESDPEETNEAPESVPFWVFCFEYFLSIFALLSIFIEKAQYKY